MLEENVPLDSSKQKQFVKSIKGIKRLLKKNKDAQPKLDDNSQSKDITLSDNEKPETKSRKLKKKSKERGLVYLSHIPHGFYEHEMTQYFKQFGVVTNARVIRSARTGNSKGHAFVEFKEPTVAQIVAETMNNYLMGKRLIKAAYIPPEEQRRRALRKRWNSKNNPGNTHRLKMKKAYNAPKNEKGELKRATKLLANLSKTKDKLGELGINYDFFKPVDVPQSLLSEVFKKEKEETGEDNGIIKHEKPNKKEDIKDEKPKTPKNKKESSEKELKKEDNVVKKKSESKVYEKKAAEKAKRKNESKTNIQNPKKLSKSDLNPLKDFVAIEHEKDSSDSAYEFDSDEFEKVIQNDESDDDDVNSNNQDSDEVTSPQQKSMQIVKTSKNAKQNVLQKNKRKAKSKVLVPPKILKLEKAKAPPKAKKFIKKKK